MYHIADPDLLKEILVKHFDKFTNRVVRMCIHYKYIHTYIASYPYVCIIYIVCMHRYKHIEHVKQCVCSFSMQLFIVKMHGYLTLLPLSFVLSISHANTDTLLCLLDYNTLKLPEEVIRWQEPHSYIHALEEVYYKCCLYICTAPRWHSCYSCGGGGPHWSVWITWRGLAHKTAHTEPSL